MKKSHKTYFLISIVSLLSLSIFFSFLNFSLAYPNDLSINNEDSDIVLESNNNGSFSAKMEGNGEYLSKNTINSYIRSDSLYEHFIPNYNYGSSSLTIFPEYLFKSETLVSNQIFSDELKIGIDNSKYDFYSDLEINLSKIEYTTSFNDYLDVVGSDANVISNNPYPNPIYETWDTARLFPQQLGYYDPLLTTYEDQDYLHLGSWAEARSFNFTVDDAYPNEFEFPQYFTPDYAIPYVNVSVEIAVEIINNDMYGDGNLTYQEYWNLLEHHYQMTLEAISDSRIGMFSGNIFPFTDREIVIANQSYWEASLMYRQAGQNQKYIFDNYYEDTLIGDGIITVDDILLTPPDRRPDTTPNPLGFSPTHWEFSNRTIINPQSITEQMFNDYSNWKGYTSNFGNPIIVFNFSAMGVGWNWGWFGEEYGNWGYSFYQGLPYITDPEDFNRAGGVGFPFRPPNMMPPTCWAKLKITEFDSKHKFEWNSNNGHFNNEKEVCVDYYDGSSWNESPIDYYGYDIFQEGWDNRSPLNSSHNYTKLKADYYNAFEDFIVTIDFVKIISYEQDLQTRSSLTIDSSSFLRNKLNWTLNFPNISNEAFFLKDSLYSKIILNLSIINWEFLYKNYSGYVYRYYFDFNYFYYKISLNYTNGYGNNLINADTSFYRHINITWYNLTLYGNYLKLLYIDSFNTPFTLTSLGYDLNDIPKWKINATLKHYWQSGTSIESILIELYLDNQSPMISDYQIHNYLDIGETKEFNISGYDSINIKEAFIIFEDNLTSDRISFPLAKKPLVNTYYRDISYGELEIGFYRAYYGLQDIAGNYNTTESFLFEMKTNLPYPFILSTTSTLPDTNGFFQIIWTSSRHTDNYTIYRYNHSISEINDSLVQIDIVDSSINSYFLTDYRDGTYYFIILAQNKFGNTTSTCFKITVEFPKAIIDDDDDKKKRTILEGEDLTWLWILMISIGAIALIGGIIRALWIRKKKKSKIRFKEKEKKSSIIGFK